MSGFSDDGRWWWDGSSWIATSRIVLPQLPPTAFEVSGQLALARAEMRKGQRAFWTSLLPMAFIGFNPQNVVGAAGYRSWTLEQMAIATTYLLGVDESMLAGEVGMYSIWDYYTRDYAVAVTTGHVLVFRIDALDGQPRWVALAARVSDARIAVRTPRWFFSIWPGLYVDGWNGRWTINGLQGFNPDPVLEAWRNAANAGT